MKLVIGYFAAFLLAVSVPHSALGQQSEWPDEIYDPGHKNHGAADLILPLPCGGAMAFQKVVVPVGSDDPLADMELRLGRPTHHGGYMDFFRTEYLRGGFSEYLEGDTNSHFFISRYELTDGQYEAIMNATSNNCPEPNRRMRLVKGGMTWFEAVELGRVYTEWLHRHAMDRLPVAGDGFGFVRLPTEPEWEYAARGGMNVTSAEFGEVRFPMDGSLNEYARYMEDGEKSLGPAGGLLPNPLGIFDIYGNAKELMHDLFRLNVSGRRHGQSGGLVTRGGSFQSGKQDINSASREEWPLFSRTTGRPYVNESIGARFVIASYVTTQSDLVVREIRESWNVRSALLNDQIEQNLELANSEADGGSTDIVSKLEEANKNLINLSEELAAAQNAIKAGRSKRASLEDNVAKQVGIATQLRKDLSKAENSLKLAENVANLERAKSINSKKLVDAANKLVSEHHARILQQQKEVDRVNQQNVQLRNQLSRLQESLENAEEKHREAQVQISLLGTRLDKALTRPTENEPWLEPERPEIERQKSKSTILNASERKANFEICMDGNYAPLCDRSMLTQQEVDRVEAAKRKDNLEICMDGNYASLCDRSMLNPLETIRVDAAERNANLEICMDGNFAPLCDRSVLTPQETIRVNEAERKANSKK